MNSGKPYESENMVSPNLAMAGTVHIFIGWGFLRLSIATMGHLTHNAYMGLVFALPIGIFYIWMAKDVARLVPERTLPGIYQRVFGKWAGGALGLFQSLLLFISAVLAVLETQLMVTNYFFEVVPGIGLMLLFAGVCVYLAFHGIKSIARFASFTLIPPLLLLYFISFFNLVNINPLNVQPVFQGTPKDWLLGALDSLYIMGASVTAFFYQQFLPDRKAILKVSLKSIGLTFPLLFLGVFGTLGAFGPEMLQKMSWPTVEFFHILDLPFILVEHAGLVFVMTWYTFILVGISSAIFLSGYHIHVLFPRFKLPWVALVIGVAVFLPPFFHQINIVFLAEVFNYLQTPFTIALLAPFMLTWLLVRIRRHSIRK